MGLDVDTPLNNCRVERSIFIYASFFTIIDMSKLVKGVNVDNINIISKLIDVDIDIIDSINLINEDNRYIFVINLKRIIKKCPYCHSENIIIKGNIIRDIVGSQYNNKPSTLSVHLKRLKCKKCNSTFNDDNPIAYLSTSFSRQAVIHILDDLKPYNSTYSSVAKKYGVSVLSIINLFDTFVQIERKPLPRVLLMDEFYFSRHSKYKYACMLMNFEKGYIVDIIESRQHRYLSNYFFNISKEEKESVEFICIDMYQPYRSIKNTYFKHATLLVDHFHVIKFINDQLNHTRKRIMRKYQTNKKSIEYKLLKKEYKLLLIKKDDVDDKTFKKNYILNYTCTRLRVLEEILKIDRELRLAYTLKELYLDFDSITKEDINNHNLEKELNELIDYFLCSKVHESVKVGKTLSNWKKEIINSFIWINDRRISNGMIEGKNNYIKKILSNANGMVNFERSRNKMIYSQNQKESYTLTPKDKYNIIRIKPKKIK